MKKPKFKVGDIVLIKHTKTYAKIVDYFQDDAPVFTGGVLWRYYKVCNIPFVFGGPKSDPHQLLTVPFRVEHLEQIAVKISKKDQELLRLLYDK